MISRDSLDSTTNTDAIARLLEEPPKPQHDRRWWIVSVLAVILLATSGYALTLGFENTAALRREVNCQAQINSAESANLVTRNPANDADRKAQDQLFATVAEAVADGSLSPADSATLNQAFTDYAATRARDDAYRAAHPLTATAANACTHR